MNRRGFLLLSSLAPVLAKDFVKKDGDICIADHEYKLVVDIRKRLMRVRRHVGYANFNYISLDDTLYFARNYSSIGNFTKDEIRLIEKIFGTDPKQFGFYGQKTINNISNKIDSNKLVKIRHSGHFVYNGKPLKDYKRLIKDVGSNLILTSGVRNVVKQLDLYLSKVISEKGNLTNASRVIAPPAYSYHTVSDFDIGKKGWGFKNFTSAFADTKEFYEMRKLDYVGIRYTVNNKDGVRFEPWHVKVI